MNANLKKFLAITTTVATIICALSSCTKSETSNHNNNQNTENMVESIKNNPYDQTDPITETPIVASRLSEKCDKILASGYGTNGSFYELVANETEDYNGTTIEIGVIENNEWSVPLTTKCAFINPETGLLNIPKQYHAEKDSGIYDEDIYFSYIGSGCFCLGKNDRPCAVWNGNTGHGYAISDETDFEWYFLPIPKNCASVDSNGIFLIVHSGNAFPLEYYDTNTNKRDIIGDLTYTTKIGPYSEELFFYQNTLYVDGEILTEVGFYNLKGEKVIDLSQYDIITEDESIFFSDDTCKIKICNDQGNYYYITIDKSGSVVDSSATIN